MARNLQTFWMVKGDGPASIHHFTEESAAQEAQRLAKANPGKTFVVMQARRAFQKIEVEELTLLDPVDPDFEEIPF